VSHSFTRTPRIVELLRRQHFHIWSNHRDPATTAAPTPATSLAVYTRKLPGNNRMLSPFLLGRCRQLLQHPIQTRERRLPEFAVLRKPRLIDPACSSTLRCFDIAGCGIENGLAGRPPSPLPRRAAPVSPASSDLRGHERRMQAAFYPLLRHARDPHRARPRHLSVPLHHPHVVVVLLVPRSTVLVGQLH